MFDYCSNCETGECEYIEVEYFINSLNKKRGCHYEFIGCPDKKKEKGVTCTADLQYRDDMSGEILTIEVKRILFGFEEDDKNENQIVALMYGMFKINNIVNDVLYQLPDHIYNELSQNYKIEIPASQLYKHEHSEFRKEFSEYLSKFDVDNMSELGNFSFKRRENVLNVKFTKLSYDEKLKFKNNENRILLQFPANLSSPKGMNIGEAYEQIYNLEKLFEKIINGLEKAENSFEGIKKNRIVLEVIVLKYGMEIFWNIPHFSRGRNFLSFAEESFKKIRDDLANTFCLFDNAYLLFNNGDKIEMLTLI